MNARQAAKLAAKRIEELEDFNRRSVADIKAYNACIDGMIQGKSPCLWCEEENECQLKDKYGKGCSEWWLKSFTQDDVNDDTSDTPITGFEPEGAKT